MGLRTYLISKGIGPYYFLTSGNPRVRSRAQAEIRNTIKYGVISDATAKKFDRLPDTVRQEILRELVSDGRFLPFVLQRVDPNVVFQQPNAGPNDQLAAIDAAISRNLPLSPVPPETVALVEQGLVTLDDLKTALDRGNKIGFSSLQAIKALNARLAQTRKFSDAVATAAALVANVGLPEGFSKPIEWKAYGQVWELIRAAVYCLAPSDAFLSRAARRSYLDLVDTIWGLNELAFPALNKARSCPLEITCPPERETAIRNEIDTLLHRLLSRQLTS
jgi:hypothetical protein